MISRDPKVRETLAGEYVLGTLHGRARRRFERWLEKDAHLRALVESWGRHLNPLAEALTPVKPPARVWRAIEKRIKPSGERRRFWDNLALWRTLGLGTSAAAVLALSVLIMVVVEPPAPDYQALLEDQRATIDRLKSERARVAGELTRLAQELADERELTALVSHTDTRVASLAGVGAAAARAAGWIVWSPEKKHGFIVVHFLPPLSAGQEYRLWVIAGERTLPAGVFTVDHVGHNALTVDVEAAEPERFEITAEPIGGGAAPSGPVLMKGKG